MGKKRIVLDTNIFISALGWEGKPREIFRRVLDGEFGLIISQSQIEELERVLAYPKFKFTEEQKSRFLTIIFEIAEVVKTSHKIDIIKDDPTDNIILESAVENNASFIVSGDEHLLKIKQFGKVKILTPSEFIKMFS